jgi:membrane fusion protein YbhG
MSKKYLFAILIFLVSCSADDQRSDAYGNFEVVDVIVSAQGNGQIISLNIAEGQKLTKNQVIGLIDTIGLHLQKKQLKSKIIAVASNLKNVAAQVEVGEQRKANLQVDRERIRKLFEGKAATQKQLDDIQGAFDLSKKQIAATQTQMQSIRDEISAMEVQIEQIDENINKCIIRSPLSGTILNQFAQEGEIAVFGKPLYKTANLDFLDLKVYVSGDQLPEIKLGQEVQVLIDKSKTENTSLKGKINWISSEAEFTPKTIQTKKERVDLVYAVKVRVKNDGLLKIGMPGEINF